MYAWPSFYQARRCDSLHLPRFVTTYSKLNNLKQGSVASPSRPVSLGNCRKISVIEIIASCFETLFTQEMPQIRSLPETTWEHDAICQFDSRFKQCSNGLPPQDPFHQGVSAQITTSRSTPNDRLTTFENLFTKDSRPTYPPEPLRHPFRSGRHTESQEYVRADPPETRFTKDLIQTTT